MRYAVIALNCLLLVMITIPGYAGDQHAEMQMDMQKMMEMYQVAATPAEPHKLFAGLAGSWTTHMKEWMEPGKPQWNRPGLRN